MKAAAAHAIASVISDDELSEDYIIPGVFDERIAQRVEYAVINAAIETGVARREPRGKGKDV